MQYTDIWVNDAYLQFMYERLLLLRELLAQAGLAAPYVLVAHSLGGLFGGIPGFANGTKFAPGGMALVGDLPPDLHEAVLSEMPHPEDPGFFRRWWRSLFG